jgi:4a-hydroxytetrahydrobiopterin dehydratase
MSEPVTASDFAARDDVSDWRYLLQRIEATFRAGSFDGAARLMVEIATAAEAADHHPDLDLRYPGRVHVVLTTHDAGSSVTDLDVALAVEISRLAGAAGATSEPLRSQVVEVAIDAMDIAAVLPFWRAVLAYVDDDAALPRDPEVISALRDPIGIGPPFWFQQMDEPRRERSRFHIDITVPHEVADERVAAAIAAGGTLVTDDFARSWWVLADPEGNEACVCTWQDRA